MPILTSEVETDTLSNMIIIGGEAGVGKTTLATSIFEQKNIMYFDAERGSKFIPGVQRYSPDGTAESHPKHWQDFVNCARETLTEGKTTLVIDNFLNVCNWLSRHVCDEGEKKDLSEFGFGKGEKKCGVEMMRIFSTLHQKNVGVVLICHKKTEYTTIKTKTNEREQANRNTLNLPTWASHIVIPMSDYIFFAYRNPFGELRVKTKGDDLNLAKDRPGFLPEDMPNNPVIFKKLMFDSNEKFTARIMEARGRMLSKWDNEAENYLKEMGIDL